MAEEKKIQYDLDAYDIITPALRELVNLYPGLDEGEEITFSTLDEEGGIAMFPVSGAAIEQEREDVTGHVRQICLYPFFIIMKVGAQSENRKANIKEWLDNFGRWLEKQPVFINSETKQLSEYPTLSGDREILEIRRSSPGYLDTVTEDMVETWMIAINVRYRNEFDR